MFLINYIDQNIYLIHPDLNHESSEVISYWYALNEQL